jgi:radical SAM-linked protein
VRQEIREILASVAKPFRYLGGEVGSKVRPWDEAGVRVCLAFPEVYEIGMSHLGLSILYDVLNGIEGVLAERAFAPWDDMEAELRERGVDLFSLESQRPLRDFDVVGISLAYELTYTNALGVLSLSGIPLWAKGRGEGDPIVIAGGPCAFNPEPVADFFDAVVIGDGEQAAIDVAKRVRSGKRDGKSRREIVNSLGEIDGVYVPSLGAGRRVGMARVVDINCAPFPAKPICAYSATQERAAVEVARGCARGCRFCQAGYAYRPVRQRSGDLAADLAVSAIGSTGREDFSFLSLSISDWQPLEFALASVHDACGAMEVNASLPSLRAEALGEGMMRELGRARSGSFTLAPEAATERMRRRINKGNTDADLYESVEMVFAGGWQAIKLYFMLGLPGETEEEVEGIVRMANRCLDIGRKYHGRPNVTVSTSTFVPKPHTPLQWDGQISVERTLELQRYLKRRLRRPGLYYRWHKAEMSFLEGVLARGGRELAGVIERAFEKGARFDGWDERFDVAIWNEAFAEAGLDPKGYMKERDITEAMPWDGLGAGPSREFLIRERERAASLVATPDCTRGECSNCGICDFKELKNRLAPATHATHTTRDTTSHESRVTSHGHRYRIRFSKTGRAAFLGQVETLDALRRALRAAGLPLAYTEGYHPRAKVSAGPALPMGVESLAEHIDVELTEEMEGIADRVNVYLSDGLRMLASERTWGATPSIEDGIGLVRYEVSTEGPGINASEAADRFKGAEKLPFTRVRRERRAEVDLKDYVAELAEGGRGVLGITVFNRKPALKISEILGAIFGISEDEARKLPVRKTAVEWKVASNASNVNNASNAGSG